MGSGAPPNPPERVFPNLGNEMAQKFGSPLFSKLNKRDWEKPHVIGPPSHLGLGGFSCAVLDALVACRFAPIPARAPVGADTGQ